ncbi:hypothetical protein [Paludisphaera rhizosphaerae]|uniref:hypothetical protein n=1 Tax=Paludisphaera rhizosphaerae TaxID=2711216 RepID=UPI0013EACE10|nr:hypothetical protein [Paludisphaera rhizosphaerae]
MLPPPGLLSVNYLAFARQVRELHRLEVAGLGDSAEADAVREASDAPWYALTKDEKDRAGCLSGDLYSISDPVPDRRAVGPLFEARLTVVNEACGRGDWDGVLALLRDWESDFPPHMLAHLRGTAWQGLGDVESAALFFEHARRLREAAGDDRSA